MHVKSQDKYMQCKKLRLCVRQGGSPWQEPPQSTLRCMLLPFWGAITSAQTSSTVKVPTAPNNSGEEPGTNTSPCARMQSISASLSTFIAVHNTVIAHVHTLIIHGQSFFAHLSFSTKATGKNFYQ